MRAQWFRTIPHAHRTVLATNATFGVAEGLPRDVLQADGTTVVGIDEETAIIDMTGSGNDWRVRGRQRAWILTGGHRRGYPDGSTLSLSG